MLTAANQSHTLLHCLQHYLLWDGCDRTNDKIDNISDIARRPPAGWSISRRLEYLDWAESVVANCPEVSEALRSRFYAALDESRKALT